MFISSWRREQRTRKEAHQPRSWRDDAWVILSAILIVAVLFAIIPSSASRSVWYVVFMAVVALVYFAFRHAGEKRRQRYHAHENPPSAER